MQQIWMRGIKHPLGNSENNNTWCGPEKGCLLGRDYVNQKSNVVVLCPKNRKRQSWAMPPWWSSQKHNANRKKLDLYDTGS